MPSAGVFKTLIATMLNRSDLTDQISTFCDMAVKTLEREKLWFQIENTTIPTVAAQSYVALPTDFVAQIDKEIGEGLLGSSGQALKPLSYSDLIYLRTANTTQGEPYYYCIADQIELSPTPDVIYTLTFSYYKSLGFPGSGLYNAWTNEAWDLTYWAVLEEAWRYMGNTEEMQKAAVMKIKRLGELRNEGGQRLQTGVIRATRF